MTASSYGKGSITLERGLYRVRVPNGRGGHRSVGSYPTMQEALENRAAALSVRAAFANVPTLREYGTRWLTRTGSQRNARSWANAWHGIVMRAPFADDPIDALTEPEVDAWLATLPEVSARRSVLRAGERVSVETGKPISRQTAQHALGLLQRCYAAAVRELGLERNPVAGAKLPDAFAAPARAEGEEVTYLSADEVEQLLGFETLPDEQRAVFTVAICQGLREGEIAALRWERIDWAAKRLWVAESWGGGKGSTKTGAVRSQTLLPRAELELQLWRALRGNPDRGLVFPARRGREKIPGPLRPGRTESTYARGFDWGWADHPEASVTRLGWWRRAGIKTRVRMHDLRDTCATHLLSGSWTDERWTLADVAAHLGHSDPRVTFKRYAHLTPEAQRRAALARRVPIKGGNGHGSPGGGGSNGGATPAANLPQRFGESVAFPPRFELGAFGLGSDRSNSRDAGKGADQVGARQVCGMLAREQLERFAAGLDVEHRAMLRLAVAAHVAGIEPELVALVLAAEGAAVLQAGLRLAVALDAAAPALASREGVA